MIAGHDGRPQLLLTFVLHDGTTRSKVCDVYEAIRQLAEAKAWPRAWADFKIEPAAKLEDRCQNCQDIGTVMTVAGRKPGETLRVCSGCIDDYREETPS
jgi:hypothetical protein